MASEANEFDPGTVQLADVDEMRITVPGKADNVLDRAYDGAKGLASTEQCQ